jgi:hypothetical protein
LAQKGTPFEAIESGMHLATGAVQKIVGTFPRSETKG